MRIKPFRALRPTQELASRVASVPYDVVNREEAFKLAEGNEISFLHVVRPDIDLPADMNAYDDAVYAKAKENFDRMIATGTLIREEVPAIYLYKQVMGAWSQIGMVCCCHIDEYESNIIKKHENTRKVKEDDRTRHVKTLNANAGPVFLTYRDNDSIDKLVDQAIRNEPLFDFTAADGVTHTVWRITKTDEYVKVFESVPFAYVADGHHRSASAWRAGKERKEANPKHTGEEEYNWFLTVMFPAGQLNILPYNRVINDLAGLSVAQLLKKLQEIGKLTRTDNPAPAGSGSFCIYVEGSWYDLIINKSLINYNDPIASLDVSLLQDQILAPIFGIDDPRTDDRVDFVGGIRGVRELERRVNEQGWALAILMYPTTVEQLISVADAGAIMPPKSTWFEPKLRSGLLIHTLD